MGDQQTSVATTPEKMRSNTPIYGKNYLYIHFVSDSGKKYGTTSAGSSSKSKPHKYLSSYRRPSSERVSAPCYSPPRNVYRRHFKKSSKTPTLPPLPEMSPECPTTPRRTTKRKHDDADSTPKSSKQCRF